ncbi:MAG TPA: L,D-transpeptidase family protein [Firmicutes bacterium]|nr:L,D-transpeptidase family protein [Bacillota bacterium]
MKTKVFALVGLAVLAVLGGFIRSSQHHEMPPPLPPGSQREVRIIVDVSKLVLTLQIDQMTYKKYPIAIGKWHTPTPIGDFRIAEKLYDPGGPFGSRWLGLNVPWGSYGIHGTNQPWSIGWAASAGCIRMFNSDVADLFDLVPVGTSVSIVGYVPQAAVERDLKPGHTGIDVQYVQFRMKQLGFDPGPSDGYFGKRMNAAVKNMQCFYGLSATGMISVDELCILGLR